MRWICLLALAALAGRGENLIRNASFEQVTDRGLPVGWEWSPARAGAEGASDAVAHGGRRSFRVRNVTPRAPHIFSHLTQTIRVRPATTYTLSCFVRGEPGVAWLGGGPGWQVREPFPAGDAWQRVSTQFTTGPDERSWYAMILTESEGEFWVDDVQLEEGTVASEFVERRPLAPGELTVQLVRGPDRRNLLPDPSFETWADGAPAGWSWDARNTDARLERLDEGHFGDHCLRVTNGTAFGAHVYAHLRLADELTVEPETDYTLSYYVRTHGRPGTAWVGGGRDWLVRVKLPETHGEWQRVTHTFRTGTETSIPVMILTESPGSFEIDDVQLEHGRLATPFEAGETLLPARLALGLSEAPGAAGSAGRWKPERYPPDRWAFAADELRFEAGLALPRPEPDGSLTVRVGAAETTLDLDGGLPTSGTVYLAYGLPAEPPEELAVEVIARAGERELARAEQAVRVVTVAQIERRLAEVGARQAPLDRLAAECDYARVTATVVRNFVGFCRDDLAGGEIGRAYDTAVLLAALADRAIAAGPRGRTPRYVTSPLEVGGPTFIGSVRLPDGTVERRPVYFTGYGHFSAVRRDLEQFPAYGSNLIQVEFGPNSVFREDERPDNAAVEEFVRLLDRAAAADVQVNLLLSPHYFPAWAFERWPHLRGVNGGFLQYDFYAPEAKQLEEAFLRHVIPQIKDHPALHSLCLSNEPLCVDARSSASFIAGWHDWLRAKYGEVTALRAAWADPVAEFEAEAPGGFEPTARCVDFVAYQQEAFAGWHAWMAGIIRELAPELPLHAKIMIGAHFGLHQHGFWSIAPELFSEWSDLNGNDCWKPPGGDERWACGWLAENMGYDYQRSAADRPIFNSENHHIPDRTLTSIAPDYLRNVIWQGAVHGQGAETTWVWERTFETGSDFTGSILHRPEVVEAKGHTGLDLMVAARELAAIAAQPAPVAIYWSQRAAILDGNVHERAVRAAYVAANFLDLPVGFVNDRDLARYAAGGESRALAAARVLLVPASANLAAELPAAAARFAAAVPRLVYLGDPPAGLPRGETISAELLAGEPEPLWQRLREVVALDPPVDVGRFGVEVRSAPFAAGRVANLCNYLNRPVTVSLPAGSVDVLTGAALPAEFELPPLVPLLLRCGE